MSYTQKQLGQRRRIYMMVRLLFGGPRLNEGGIRIESAGQRVFVGSELVVTDELVGVERHLKLLAKQRDIDVTHITWEKPREHPGSSTRRRKRRNDIPA
jgi:hypothetical protein